MESLGADSPSKDNHCLCVGRGTSFRQFHELVLQVAPTELPVLITGETGTGKELIAREIHRRSPRAEKNFIAINCGALAEGVLESELFGHRKGSFTGAVQDQIGLFESATGGTVFLDELGEIPLRLQCKLLRFLQFKEIQRVGDSQVRRLDTRILAATNRNLQKEVQQKRFRQDLFYRINVFEIHLPPLRERGEDIPALVEHFLAQFSQSFNKQVTMSPEAMAVLMNYSWPGNIRELENILGRAFLVSNGCGKILVKDLPRALCEFTGIDSIGPVYREDFEDMEPPERKWLRQRLESNRWNQTRTARELGMKRTTLQYRMKKLGLDSD